MTQFPADLIAFIDNVDWTFAKTYADTWPHSYIVLEKMGSATIFDIIRPYATYATKKTFKFLKLS